MVAEDELCEYCGQELVVIGSGATAAWQAKERCTNPVGHWPKGKGWEGRPEVASGR